MNQRLRDGRVVPIPSDELQRRAARRATEEDEAEQRAAREALRDIDARTIRALREWAAEQNVQVARDLEAEAEPHRGKLRGASNRSRGGPS